LGGQAGDVWKKFNKEALRDDTMGDIILWNWIGF
jgi:hypothetical protein